MDDQSGVSRARKLHQALLPSAPETFETDLEWFSTWANNTIEHLLLIAVETDLSNESRPIDAEGWLDKFRQGSIHCALWPDSTINAMSIGGDDCALILINIGLYNAVCSLSKIVVGMASRIYPDGSTAGPIIDHAEAIRHFNTLLFGVVDNRNPSPPQFEIGDEMEQEVMSKARIAIDYVIAHELSHVLLGHLNDGATIVETEPQPGNLYWDVSGLLVSSILEIDTDGLATNLHGRRFGVDVDDHRYTGEMLFFEVLEISTIAQYIRAREKGKQESSKWNARRAYATHPVPAWRRAMAISGNHPDSWDACLPACDGYLNLFNVLHEWPMHEADAEALEELARMADNVDPDVLQSMLWTERHGEIDGMTKFKDSIQDFFRQDVSIVAPYVAWAACKYMLFVFRPAKSISERSQLVLYVYYRLFSQAHLKSNATDEAEKFDQLLNQAVPSINQIESFSKRVLTPIYDPDGRAGREPGSAS